MSLATHIIDLRKIVVSYTEYVQVHKFVHIFQYSNLVVVQS